MSAPSHTPPSRSRAGVLFALLACALAGLALWWWRDALGLGAWPALLLWALVASKIAAVALALRASRR